MWTEHFPVRKRVRAADFGSGCRWIAAVETRAFLFVWGEGAPKPAPEREGLPLIKRNLVVFTKLSQRARPPERGKLPRRATTEISKKDQCGRTTDHR